MDIPSIFLLLLAISVIYIIFVLAFGNKDMKSQTEKYYQDLKRRNVISEYEIIHLTGHPYLKTNDLIKLQIKTNNIINFFKENVNTGEEIQLSQIIRYEIKTETEIQKDVTLTRLLTLGIFAFGVKKTTKIEEQLFIISYNQNGIEITCIFKQRYKYQNLHEIVSALNRLRIKNNKLNSNQEKSVLNL